MIHALAVLFTLPTTDLMPLVLASLVLWATVACAWELVRPEPYPLFFGVPSRRAHWQPHQSHALRWIVAIVFVSCWLIWQVVYR